MCRATYCGLGVVKWGLDGRVEQEDLAQYVCVLVVCVLVVCMYVVCVVCIVYVLVACVCGSVYGTQ